VATMPQANLTIKGFVSPHLPSIDRRADRGGIETPY
jgi:hypothetical protein